jgi:1-deoxy-D-xylulose-5-phosphate synthase
MTEWKTPFREIAPGKSSILREGEEIAILSIGPLGNSVNSAINELEKEDISVAHYDVRFLKPLDKEMLHDVFRRFSGIITVEDGVVTGGLGSAVLEFMADNGYHARVKRLGIPDGFIEQGTLEELHRKCGFDTGSIIKTVREMKAGKK